MVKININYIADLSIPNKSAYAVHVLKISDNFIKFGCNLKLYLYSNQKRINAKKIKNDFNLSNLLNINYCFKKKVKRTFFNNIFFSFWCSNKINKKSLVISRSIISALILNILKFRVILEIHHEMTGFTKIFYQLTTKLKIIKNLKFIFIHKNLQKIFDPSKKNSIVLDDGVDIDDFLFDINSKKTCAYTGSFAKGKGIELISKIAAKNPKILFYAYGNIDTLSHPHSFKKIKNLIFQNYQKYKNIPKILKKNLILLMPYQKKIGILAKNISVENYISPLKLFEYLASSNIIIASNLKVYSHILKDKFNCLLCEPSNIDDWSSKITYAINSSNKLNYLRKNAFKSAKKYTWIKRVSEIVNFSQKQNLL